MAKLSVYLYFLVFFARFLNNFVNIQNIVEKVQKTQGKKVHIITFTAEEFKQELNRPNKVFIEAIKKGIILFGQEKFIQFMKRLSIIY